MPPSVSFHQRFQLQPVALQDLAQFAQVLHDDVRLAGPQLVQAVVAGQHRAGMDAAVLGRFDVVLHVANKKRFGRGQLVFRQQFHDLEALVPYPGVSAVNELVKTARPGLEGEVVRVDGAQNKGAQAALAAVKAPFQLGYRDVRNEAVVEMFERQAELGAEFVQAQWLHPTLLEDGIGGRQHRRQIIHQRPRPIKNNVPNHGSKGRRKKEEGRKSSPRQWLFL